MSTSRSQDDDINRVLRASVGNGAPGDCPGASEMAAFVEGAVADDERTALESHFAACERCQSALAMLAASEPVREVSRKPRRAWFTGQGWLRWIVPAGAAVAALFVYLAVKPPEPLMPAASPSAKAEKMVARTVPQQEAPVELKNEPILTPAEPSQEKVPAPQRESAKDIRILAGRKADAANETKVAQAAPPVAAVPLLPPPAGVVTETEKTQALDRVAPLPAAKPEATPKSVRLGESRVAMARGVAASDSAAFRQASPLFASTRDGATLWRFTSDGQIARSTDRATTWQRQSNAQASALIAAAAPDAATCWAVGRKGAILLTTDGITWATRPFPEAVDLVAVEATDATKATVTTSDGRRFTTSDGGGTWSAVK